MSRVNDEWYEFIAENHFEKCDFCAKSEADNWNYDFTGCAGFKDDLVKAEADAESFYWDNVNHQIDENRGK